MTDQPPVAERRRANRVRSGPLPVHIQGQPEGTLLDLSEAGALLELSRPHDVNSRVTFELLWEGIAVQLNGRVVRSTPSYGALDRLTWAEPSGYHVAVEFFDVTAECAMTLHDVVRNAARRAADDKQQTQP